MGDTGNLGGANNTKAEYTGGVSKTMHNLNDSYHSRQLYKRNTAKCQTLGFDNDKSDLDHDSCINNNKESVVGQHNKHNEPKERRMSG